MAEPISINQFYNQDFTHDYHKFVLQDPNPKVNPLNHFIYPPKPFEIKKTSKTKKDLKKDKDSKKDLKKPFT